MNPARWPGVSQVYGRAVACKHKTGRLAIAGRPYWFHRSYHGTRPRTRALLVHAAARILARRSQQTKRRPVLTVQPVGINSRRLVIVAIAVTVLAGMVGCSSNYPPQHNERLRKAAGVVTFRINCAKDLWERTKETYDYTIRPRSVKDLGNGMVSVALSGPQLVDYLSSLGEQAFSWGSRSDPLAERMYNAIAPEIDKIRGPLKPGDPIPEVSVNDAAVPAVSSSAAATPEASKSN